MHQMIVRIIVRKQLTSLIYSSLVALHWEMSESDAAVLRTARAVGVQRPSHGAPSRGVARVLINAQLTQ